MTNKEYAEVVLRELTHTLTRIDSEQAEKFVELVDGAKKYFVPVLDVVVLKSKVLRCV